jgi:hypothetical protein
MTPVFNSNFKRLSYSGQGTLASLRNLNYFVVKRRIRTATFSACHFDADPDPAYHFDADPDPYPAYHFDANPDPTF